MSQTRTKAFPTITILLALACFSLAYWQSRRLVERRTEVSRIEALRELPEIDLSTSTAGLGERRVRARGRWLHDRQMVLRGRARRGVPGVELVTPLALEGSDTVLLVARGWVPAPDGVTLDESLLDRPDSGTVTGIAVQLAEQPDDGGPLDRKGLRTWRRLDLSSAREAVPGPVLGLVLLPDPDSSASGYPRAQPHPVLGDGPHLSYMIQWIAFGLIALIGGQLYLRKEST